MGRYNEELPTVFVYYQTRVYSKLKKNDFLTESVFDTIAIKSKARGNNWK